MTMILYVLCYVVYSFHHVSTAVNSVLEDLRMEIKQLRATTTSNQVKAETEIQNLKAEINQLKNTNNKRALPETNLAAEKPAFAATMSDHAKGLGRYQTIVFDTLYNNDLGCYSPVTGVFTAPMNGTYFFTSTVMSHTGQYLETEICLNGQTLVLMYSYDTKHEQGTNSVVLALKTGDSVWVRLHVTEGSMVYGYNWSTFSGFMI
ncbi:C1q and tumor necrosis factor protein 4 [Mactra antiquata]